MLGWEDGPLRNDGVISALFGVCAALQHGPGVACLDGSIKCALVDTNKTIVHYRG